MSATELAVVMKYVVSLQQQFDALQYHQQQIQQVQQLQARVADLERNSTCTEHALWFVLSQTLEDVANLRAVVVDADHCDESSLEDYWSQRYPEAFE